LNGFNQAWKKKQSIRESRGVEEKSMLNTNAYVGIEEREEILSEAGVAQQLEQILASGPPSLYRRAYRILGNAADAKDAVQDALLAAYTHLHQFRGQAQISTWLTTIVLNCAQLQLRRRPRHVHVSLDESAGDLQTLSVSERIPDYRPNPEDEYRESELSTRLSHLHSQFSPTLPKTFLLRDVDGLSIRETARILGVPTGTVKAQFARVSQKTQRIDAAYPQAAISQAAKSIVALRKFGSSYRCSRVTDMVGELLVDNESHRAGVLGEGTHETVR
jgi:RNA polymerase sigma-70 factor (ECF subfamily)